MNVISPVPHPKSGCRLDTRQPRFYSNDLSTLLAPLSPNYLFISIDTPRTYINRSDAHRELLILLWLSPFSSPAWTMGLNTH
jgi:hypothetical protein